MAPRTPFVRLHCPSLSGESHARRTPLPRPHLTCRRWRADRRVPPGWTALHLGCRASASVPQRSPYREARTRGAYPPAVPPQRQDALGGEHLKSAGGRAVGSRQARLASLHPSPGLPTCATPCVRDDGSGDAPVGIRGERAMKMLVATRIPFLVLKRQGCPGAAVAALLLAVNPAAVAAGRILNHALRRAGAGSQAMSWPDPEGLLMLPCTCPQCGTHDARKVLADGRASHQQPQRPRSGPGRWRAGTGPGFAGVVANRLCRRPECCSSCCSVPFVKG